MTRAPDRALDGLGLPRVVRARVLVRRRRSATTRVEVMVGIDALSQQTVGDQAALRPPRDAGLGRARAVPALHPAGLGHRALGQARAVRRDGARGRRRGGRRAPAVPLAEGLRPRVRRRHRGAGGLDRARLRGREHVPVAGLRPARHGDVPARLGPVGASPTPTPRSTSRTPRSRTPTWSRWPSRLGDRLRHIHLTDGTGSAKDEHLVPGPRLDGRRRRSCATWRRPASTARSCSRSTPASATTGAEREARPARVAGVRPRAPRRGHAVSRLRRRVAGRRPGAPDTRAGDPRARRASCSPRRASPARRCARSPPRPASTPRWCTTTSAPRTTCSSPPSSCAVDPRVALLPVIEGGVDGAGERLLRVFLSVWDDEETRLPLLGAGARGPRPGRPAAGARRLPPDGARPGRRRARHRPARAPDAAGRLAS